MKITDARSVLTDALQKQGDRVARNSEKIAKVGLEKPVERVVKDKVELSPEARVAQEAANVNSKPVELRVEDENVAAVLVDNKQAEIAYKAAATTLKVVDNMEGALLEQIRNREV